VRGASGAPAPLSQASRCSSHAAVKARVYVVVIGRRQVREQLVVDPRSCSSIAAESIDRTWQAGRMATYAVSRDAVGHARRLIDA